MSDEEFRGQDGGAQARGAGGNPGAPCGGPFAGARDTALPAPAGLCFSLPGDGRLAQRGLAKNMKPTNRAEGEAAAANITRRIQELADWRGATLARVRQLIHIADPDIQEEWKWRGTPVWSHDGIVCTGESYREVVKLTFARGAALKDPNKLFNSSLEGSTRRAIDLREGEKIKEAALRQLIRAAVAANGAARAERAAKKK
jgi:hypothetical protein